MSIIDTLITDRTAADTAALEALFAKARAGSLTEEEKAILADPAHKGAYNYTDLNRVSTALEYLKARLEGYGYATPGYQRIEVPHRTVASSKLPAGFTELSYIESSGTQYIDTGFNPNQDSRVVLDAQMLEGSAPTKSKIYFGCRSGGRYFEIYKASSSNQNLYFLYNDAATLTFSVDYSLRRTVEINKNIATVDGVSKEATYAEFQIGRSIFIGADNNDGTPASITSMRIYACQIYDNGTLVRDYVPVKDANGNVGLYDLAEGKFYTNAGTGAFIAGAVKVKLPDGYTQAEYIQSSGTQYVDTGISPTNNTKVCMDFQLVENTNTPTLFGSRNTSTNSMFFVYLETSGNTWYACYGTQWVNFTTSTDSLSRKQLEFGSTGGFIGEESKTWTAQTISSNYPIVLFARNTNGTIGQSAKMHLYSCQIYDNGTLVRDFVPCKNPEGAYGLYDKVNAVFYGNAGSGAFTVGAVVDPPVPSVPSDDETRDPFLWYEDDIPTAAQMAQYSLNVAVVRGTLAVLPTTPAAPSDMEGLTVEEANAIEFILIDVETLINNMAAAWFYSGDLYSGEV